jgi:hypothetical protein
VRVLLAGLNHEGHEAHEGHEVFLVSNLKGRAPRTQSVAENDSACPARRSVVSVASPAVGRRCDRHSLIAVATEVPSALATSSI